eukprot:jgi/Mesvir1/5484/Mv15532-RA.1
MDIHLLIARIMQDKLARRGRHLAWLQELTEPPPPAALPVLTGPEPDPTISQAPTRLAASGATEHAFSPPIPASASGGHYDAVYSDNRGADYADHRDAAAAGVRGPGALAARVPELDQDFTPSVSIGMHAHARGFQEHPEVVPGARDPARNPGPRTLADGTRNTSVAAGSSVGTGNVTGQVEPSHPAASSAPSSQSKPGTRRMLDWGVGATTVRGGDGHADAPPLQGPPPALVRDPPLRISTSGRPIQLAHGELPGRQLSPPAKARMAGGGAIRERVDLYLGAGQGRAGNREGSDHGSAESVQGVDHGTAASSLTGGGTEQGRTLRGSTDGQGPQASLSHLVSALGSADASGEPGGKGSAPAVPARPAQPAVAAPPLIAVNAGGMQQPPTSVGQQGPPADASMSGDPWTFLKDFHASPGNVTTTMMTSTLGDTIPGIGNNNNNNNNNNNHNHNHHNLNHNNNTAWSSIGSISIPLAEEPASAPQQPPSLLGSGRVPGYLRPLRREVGRAWRSWEADRERASRERLLMARRRYGRVRRSRSAHGSGSYDLGRGSQGYGQGGGSRARDRGRGSASYDLGSSVEELGGTRGGKDGGVVGGAMRRPHGRGDDDASTIYLRPSGSRPRGPAGDDGDDGLVDGGHRIGSSSSGGEGRGRGRARGGAGDGQGVADGSRIMVNERSKRGPGGSISRRLGGAGASMMRALNPELTFHPQINPRSETIVRGQEAARASSQDRNQQETEYYERLYRLFLDHDKTQAKREAIRQEREEAQLRECTFNPSLCERSRNFAAFWDPFLDRVAAWQENRDRKVERHRQEVAESELVGCTFRPQLIDASWRYTGPGARGRRGADASKSLSPVQSPRAVAAEARHRTRQRRQRVAAERDEEDDYPNDGDRHARRPAPQKSRPGRGSLDSDGDGDDHHYGLDRLGKRAAAQRSVSAPHIRPQRSEGEDRDTMDNQDPYTADGGHDHHHQYAFSDEERNPHGPRDVPTKQGHAGNVWIAQESSYSDQDQHSDREGDSPGAAASNRRHSVGSVRFEPEGTTQGHGDIGSDGGREMPYRSRRLKGGGREMPYRSRRLEGGGGGMRKIYNNAVFVPGDDAPSGRAGHTGGGGGSSEGQRFKPRPSAAEMAQLASQIFDWACGTDTSEAVDRIAASDPLAGGSIPLAAGGRSASADGGDGIYTAGVAGSAGMREEEGRAGNMGGRERSWYDEDEQEGQGYGGSLGHRYGVSGGHDYGDSGGHADGVSGGHDYGVSGDGGEDAAGVGVGTGVPPLVVVRSPPEKYLVPDSEEWARATRDAKAYFGSLRQQRESQGIITPSAGSPIRMSDPEQQRHVMRMEAMRERQQHLEAQRDRFNGSTWTGRLTRPKSFKLSVGNWGTRRSAPNN